MQKSMMKLMLVNNNAEEHQIFLKGSYAILR